MRRSDNAARRMRFAARILLWAVLTAVGLGAAGCFNLNVKVDKDAIDVPGYKWKASDSSTRPTRVKVEVND